MVDAWCAVCVCVGVCWWLMCVCVAFESPRVSTLCFALVVDLIWFDSV